jgi:hypothetical protein
MPIMTETCGVCSVGILELARWTDVYTHSLPAIIMEETVVNGFQAR